MLLRLNSFYGKVVVVKGKGCGAHCTSQNKKLFNYVDQDFAERPLFLGILANFVLGIVFGSCTLFTSTCIIIPCIVLVQKLGIFKNW